MTFEQWLRSNPDHKYKDATIKRYIRALEKSEEWLNITLPRKILMIHDKDEFATVVNMIQSVPDYKDINFSHGHGDLSAALGLYQKYLENEQKGSMNHTATNTKNKDTTNTAQLTSIKNVLLYIESFIQLKGFSYTGSLIQNFYLSLKSKPFVILAGTSGTGKTRLVKLFAEAIGAEYFLIPVRPDWSDGSDLFGHTNLKDIFVPGPICVAFDTAINNPEKPVFICLDEMNLARVEYYLSDFLSVVESREKLPDGSIKTGSIAHYSSGIPDNLYIVGTVNMDETTFPFSKKVLDRANTIEFNYVDLMPSFLPEKAEEKKPLALTNDFLRTEYLVLTRDCSDEVEFVVNTCHELERINKILRKANLHIGYRVRDEIVFYLLNNKKAGNLIPPEEAMDNEIMQKIPPRIQGSSNSVKVMLQELFTPLTDQSIDENEANDSIASAMQSILAKTKVKYPKSTAKLSFMMQRFEEDGFTSYWL